MEETKKKVTKKVTDPIKSMNAHQRVHAVMTECKQIGKNGHNKFQNYDFATESDFVRMVQPLLVKYRLAIETRTSQPHVVDQGDKGGKLTTMMLEMTFVNIDDPKDRVTNIIGGQGSDKGDKGIYKAITGAKKYLFAVALCIPTGDDPEGSGKKPSQSSAGANSIDEDF